MGATDLKKCPVDKKALEVISEIVDECPNCGSVDFGHDRDTDMTICNECLKPFDLDQCSEKLHIVKTLRFRGLSHAADQLQEMNEDSFESFMKNYVL